MVSTNPLLINQHFCTSYCVFKNLYPSSSEDTTTEEISTQNITTNNKPSSNEMTKDDFLLEIHQFKQQKLYEEALSCIQLLFEKNIVDSDIIYELADTYLCLHDYERAFNWTQKVKSINLHKIAVVYF